MTADSRHRAFVIAVATVAIAAVARQSPQERRAILQRYRATAYDTVRMYRQHTGLLYEAAPHCTRHNDGSIASTSCLAKEGTQ